MMIPRTLQILFLAAGLFLLAFSGFYAFELKEQERTATAEEYDFRDETNLELYTLSNTRYEDGAAEPAELQEVLPQDMQVGKGQPLVKEPLNTEPEQAALLDTGGGAYHLPFVLAGAGGLFIFLGLFSFQYKK